MQHWVLAGNEKHALVSPSISRADAVQSEEHCCATSAHTRRVPVSEQSIQRTDRQRIAAIVA